MRNCKAYVMRVTRLAAVMILRQQAPLRAFAYQQQHLTVLFNTYSIEQFRFKLNYLQALYAFEYLTTESEIRVPPTTPLVGEHVKPRNYENHKEAGLGRAHGQGHENSDTISYLPHASRSHALRGNAAPSTQKPGWPGGRSASEGESHNVTEGDNNHINPGGCHATDGEKQNVTVKDINKSLYAFEYLTTESEIRVPPTTPFVGEHVSLENYGIRETSGHGHGRLHGQGHETAEFKNPPHENINTGGCFTTDGCKTENNLLVNYYYDAAGRVHSVSYTYDSAGRAQTVTSAYSGMPSYTMTYDYYDDGRLKSVDGPAGARTMLYDDAGRLTRMTSPSGLFSFDYNDRGLLRHTLYPPSGLGAEYVYDDSGQLRSVINANGTAIIARRDYDYDGAGNRKSITGCHTQTCLGVNPDSATGSDTSIYEYDKEDRLKNADHPAESEAWLPDEYYVDDWEGNIQRSHRNPGVAMPSTQEPGWPGNAANQLVSDDEYDYQYDADGNLSARIRKGTGATTLYAWTPENRLSRVILEDGRTLELSYDALGRKVERLVRAASGAGLYANFYAYNGADLEVDYYGNGTPKVKYTYGPGIDNALAAVFAGSNFYFLKDAQNSVLAIINYQKTVLKTYAYDSYGNIVKETGYIPFENAITYTGRVWLPELKMYDYRARYYDPRAARFISEDPIWNTNLYAYVSNNPLLYVDLWGELECEGVFPLMCGPVTHEDLDEPPTRFFYSDLVDKGRNLNIGKYAGSETDPFAIKTVGSVVIKIGAHFIPNDSNELGLSFIMAYAGAGASKLLGTVAKKIPFLRKADDLVKEGTGIVSETGIVACPSGMTFSTHAIEQMTKREVTQNMVESTVKNGTKYWDEKNKTVSYVLEKGFKNRKFLQVAIDENTNNVVTVIVRDKFNPLTLLDSGKQRYIKMN